MSLYMLTFDEMTGDEHGWSLVDNDLTSIDNMSDKEVRESILEDLLTVTMYEFREKVEVQFSEEDLLKWLPKKKRNRVIEAMNHPEIKDLLDKSDDRIRVKKYRDTLRAAMEYCGIYYVELFSAEEIPKDIIFGNQFVLKEAAEECGGIENLTRSMAMDMKATHGVSTSIH